MATLMAAQLGVLSHAHAQLSPDMTPSLDRSYDCVMEPFKRVNLSTSVEGVLESVNVERGDMVRKGQVIARLQSHVEEAEVELARLRAGNTHRIESQRARVRYLEARYGRTEKLNSTDYVPDALVEEVEADLRIAQEDAREAVLEAELSRMELSRAQALLKQREVRSPVDGVVTERLLGPGEYRNEQSHIVTVAQIDPINVEVYAPIALHGQIAVGDKALVRPEEPVGGDHEATVTIVDKVYDAASGTFGVRLSLPNPDYKIPTGIKCEILFDASLDAPSILDEIQAEDSQALGQFFVGGGQGDGGR